VGISVSCGAESGPGRNCAHPQLRTRPPRGVAESLKSSLRRAVLIRRLNTKPVFLGIIGGHYARARARPLWWQLSTHCRHSRLSVAGTPMALDGWTLVAGVVVLSLPIAIWQLNRRKPWLGWTVLALLVAAIGLLNLVLVGRVVP